jgi:hypothetical protein
MVFEWENNLYLADFPAMLDYQRIQKRGPQTIAKLIYDVVN